jgi:hypothetical protein
MRSHSVIREEPLIARLRDASVGSPAAPWIDRAAVSTPGSQRLRSSEPFWAVSGLPPLTPVATGGSFIRFRGSIPCCLPLTTNSCVASLKRAAAHATPAARPFQPYDIQDPITRSSREPLCAARRDAQRSEARVPFSTRSSTRTARIGPSAVRTSPRRSCRLLLNGRSLGERLSGDVPGAIAVPLTTLGDLRQA